MNSHLNKSPFFSVYMILMAVILLFRSRPSTTDGCTLAGSSAPNYDCGFEYGDDGAFLLATMMTVINHLRCKTHGQWTKPLSLALAYSPTRMLAYFPTKVPSGDLLSYLNHRVAGSSAPPFLMLFNCMIYQNFCVNGIAGSPVVGLTTTYVSHFSRVHVMIICPTMALFFSVSYLTTYDFIVEFENNTETDCYRALSWCNILECFVINCGSSGGRPVVGPPVSNFFFLCSRKPYLGLLCPLLYICFTVYLTYIVCPFACPCIPRPYCTAVNYQSFSDIGWESYP